jgi:hypothetical protein
VRGSMLASVVTSSCPRDFLNFESTVSAMVAESS